MKVKFWYPIKEEKGIKLNRMEVKLNSKYVFDYYNDGVNWKIVNCLNIKALVILGSIPGSGNYWCNTIPFQVIYTKFPILRSDNKRFDKKGFHKRIIKSIFTTIKIKESLDGINLPSFKKFVFEEFGVKI